MKKEKIKNLSNRENRRMNKNLVCILLAICLMIGSFIVFYGVSKQNNKSNISESVQVVKANLDIELEEYNKNTTNANTLLKGEVEENIEKIVCKTENSISGEEYISEDKIKVDGENWQIEKILLRPGDNKITIHIETANKVGNKEVYINYDSGIEYKRDESNVVKVKSEDNNEVVYSYTNNIIIIDFEENIEEVRKQEIIESIEGYKKTVGKQNVIDRVEIEVETANEEELNKKIEEIKNIDGVYDAYIDYIIPTETCVEKGTWKYQNEIYDSTRPDGNNWYLEAVGVIDAWNYIDENNLWKQSTTVGVHDEGLWKHSNLNYSEIYGNYSTNPNVNHGVSVAGTIASTYNSNQSTSGVNPYCDLKGFDHDIYSSSFDECMMIEEYNCKIINHSWNYAIRLMKAYTQGEAFEEGKKAIRNKQNMFENQLKRLVDKRI